MSCALVCVTGCIAAYKSCELVRMLQKSGVRVKVLMTEHAAEFVGPTTFRALTREPVAVGLFDDPNDPIHHISLAKEADAVIIAPATANVLAKLAHGEADDLLASGLIADDWVWSAPADAMEELLDEAGAAGVPAGAKIRYHHPTRACRMRRGADGSVELAFDEDERGIAPGQAVVAYAGDVVLGGGTVVRALR